MYIWQRYFPRHVAHFTLQWIYPICAYINEKVIRKLAFEWKSKSNSHSNSNATSLPRPTASRYYNQTANNKQLLMTSSKRNCRLVPLPVAIAHLANVTSIWMAAVLLLELSAPALESLCGRSLFLRLTVLSLIRSLVGRSLTAAQVKGEMLLFLLLCVPVSVLDCVWRILATWAAFLPPSRGSHILALSIYVSLSADCAIFLLKTLEISDGSVSVFGKLKSSNAEHCIVSYFKYKLFNSFHYVAVSLYFLN